MQIDIIPTSILTKLYSPSLYSISSLGLQRWSLSLADISPSYFPALTHLAFVSNHTTVTDEEALEKFGNLRSLTIRFITEKLLQNLTKLTQLESLNVGKLSETRTNIETIEYSSKSGREVTDDTFHYVTKLSSLKSLCLNGLGITDGSLEKLTQLGNLTHLDITWCQRITDTGLMYLTTLTNLKTLDLWRSGVSEAGINRFRSSKGLENCKICSHFVKRPYDL